MKVFSTLFKRSQAMLLAVALVFSVMSTGLCLSFNATEVKTYVTLTDGEIVAKNYDELSDSEKQILSSGYLAGATHTYSVPTEDDDLISVDLDTKTIHAKSYEEETGYLWTPVNATIVVGTEVKETVTLTDGSGVYTFDGDAFSVKVDYEMVLSVDEELQKTLLETPDLLKQGIANLDVVADQSGKLVILEEAMPKLVKLANDGIPTSLGTVYLSDEGVMAVNTWNAQMTANGGHLDLCAMISDYQSGSGVQYLLTEGINVLNEVIAFNASVAVIGEALDTIENNLDLLLQWGAVDQTTANQIELLNRVISDLETALISVPDADWTAAERGIALVKTDLTALEYSKLDVMVAALGKTTDVSAITIKNPLAADTTSVQFNMSMSDVNVKVVLKVVDGITGSAILVEYGSKSTVITLSDGATPAEIEAAVVADGIEAAALAEWAGVYIADKFEVSRTELPESLDADIDYVITYSPKNYNVTFKYDDSTVAYPYGYRLELPKCTEEGKVFDYTVNGNYYAEGSVYVVTDTAEIDRATGKPYVHSNLNQVVSDRYFEDGSKADSILASGALLIGNESVNVRYPDNNSGSLVKISDGVLTADKYPASYNDLEWIPYSYTVVVDGVAQAARYFNGANEVSITDPSYDRVEVIYRLALTNISEDNILDLLNVPGNLAAEAKEQLSVLNRLAAYHDQIGQLDKTKLGALNGVIDVTDLNDDPETNAALKAEFSAAVKSIINTCLTGNVLTIYNLIGEYNNGGLAYYYRNSDVFIQEVTALSGYLSSLTDSEEKLAALAILTDVAGYPEYAEKVTDLNTVMDEVKESLTAPNASIDLTSANLNKLVDALTMAGSVASYTQLPGDLYLESDAIVVNAQDKVTVTVTVQVEGGKPISVSKSYTKDHTITLTDVEAILAEVNTAISQLNVSDKYYNNPYSEDLIKSFEGLSAEDLESTYNYIWTPKSFTVSVKDQEDQAINVNDLSIDLAASPDAAYRYEYVIDGVVVPSGSYTFTLEQIDRLFANNKYSIERVKVEIARENLINMVNTLNESVGSDTAVFALVENNGKYSIVMKVDAADTAALKSVLQPTAMGLINSGYSYIGMDNNGVLYMDENSSLKISLQAVVDAVMNSGFGTATIINVMDENGVINNVSIEGTVLSDKVLTSYGGQLVKTSMQLGNSKDDAMDVDFYITLGSAPASMLQIRNLLVNQLNNYLNIECNDNKAMVSLTMPQKAYEVYLAALLATDNLDITDLNSVNAEIAIGFVKDLADPIFGGDVTATTLTNTLNMLGYNIDLTGYQTYYDAFCNVYASMNLVYDETSGTATGNIGISNLIDSLNLGEMGKMIVEYETGLNITVTVALENLGKDYEALYFDVNASGVANKFGLTENIADTLENVSDTAVIVLLDNITGDLVFDTTTVLNLNGFNVNGNILCNGNVTVIDTTLSADSCGEVSGTVSGNVTVLAGKYDSDVSDFIVNGYIQDAEGIVRNEMYTLVKDEDGNITVEIDAGVINIDSLPALRSMAIDVVAELIFNGYTVNELYIDDNMVYNITLEDLIALYTGSDRVDALVNKMITMVDSNALANLINTVLADITDFAALKTAIETNNPVLSYPMTTGSWTVGLEHITDGDYVTANILPSEEKKERTLSVKIVGEQSDKDILAGLMGELDATTAATVKVNMAHGLASADDQNLVLDWSATANVVVDLSQNPAYAVMLSIILADGIGASSNGDLIAGIKTYYETGSLEYLETAFNALKTSQVITALRNLSKTDDFATMVSNLGLEDIVGTDVTELEKLYDSLSKMIAAAVRKANITGGDRTLESFLNADGAFTVSRNNVNRSFSRDLFLGYSLTLNVEVTDLLFSVKLFGEHVKNPEFIDGTGTPVVNANSNLVASRVDTANKIFMIDTSSDGISAGELKSLLTFYANNADEISITIGSGDDNALVCNGVTVVATATNAESSVPAVVEYTVIVLGDVNCNGQIEVGDASMIREHFLYSTDLNSIQKMAADTNLNGELEVGDASIVRSKFLYWEDYKSLLIAQ